MTVHLDPDGGDPLRGFVAWMVGDYFGDECDCDDRDRCLACRGRDALAAAASRPDERLREAGERLAQAVARVCGEGHPALGMWRVALASADREVPSVSPEPDADA